MVSWKAKSMKRRKLDLQKEKRKINQSTNQPTKQWNVSPCEKEIVSVLYKISSEQVRIMFLLTFANNIHSNAFLKFCDSFLVQIHCHIFAICKSEYGGGKRGMKYTFSEQCQFLQVSKLNLWCFKIRLKKGKEKKTNKHP